MPDAKLIRRRCGSNPNAPDEDVYCLSAEISEPQVVASLGLKLLAEAIGTGIIVLIGVGSVVTAVTSGSLQGLWQVAVVWGVGVSVAIATTASVSGAHLNPAITIAAALFTGFPKKEVLPYIGAQMAGATICGFINLIVHGGAIARFEKKNGITRGEEGSVMSAMAFGEYYPNPGIHGYDDEAKEIIGTFGALLVEAWGTFILAFVIRAVTDERNTAVSKRAAPGIIGFTVSMLISVYAPLTQAGWNPARDFGPRLVAAVAGWGTVAIPGPRYGFWVYILGPIIGAVAAFGLYNLFFSEKYWYVKAGEQYSTKDLKSSPEVIGKQCCAPEA
eukprot:gnl/TRDRNA2_/TRDRNA2_193918_c0_seq1.p1 gnl/TRDRNA2_/TRDRNA2_193918_c0~~gnl/TRDRNA2_/TRDRNA2_193918_c0_seq1.p1  ORF type:complete len:349 (-),score=56.83 gnl/TRDRNA2_/TRDRNA2_193918_c0_seq1:239-1231(-)